MGASAEAIRGDVWSEAHHRSARPPSHRRRDRPRHQRRQRRGVIRKFSQFSPLFGEVHTLRRSWNRFSKFETSVMRITNPKPNAEILLHCEPGNRRLTDVVAAGSAALRLAKCVASYGRVARLLRWCGTLSAG